MRYPPNDIMYSPLEKLYQWWIQVLAHWRATKQVLIGIEIYVPIIPITLTFMVRAKEPNNGRLEAANAGFAEETAAGTAAGPQGEGGTLPPNNLPTRCPKCGAFRRAGGNGACKRCDAPQE